MDFTYRSEYDINDLLKIMEILRSDEGCPWDREQTHESIRKNFIEETYEVCEAIDNSDPELLKEELGDVLLQVVFHSRMEEESGSFSFKDVCDGICKKLIERHPHVFSDVSVENTGQVLENWDKIKQESKGQKTYSQTLTSVPKVLPSLMRAQKVQQRAAKSGFDHDDASGAIAELGAQLELLKSRVESGEADAPDELGRLLFSAVGAARKLGIDSETALSRETENFISRFEKLEAEAEKQKLDLKRLSPETLDRLWDESGR